MGFIKGTIMNDPNPAGTMLGILETEMNLAGWVFVEEVISGNLPHRIWRNPATLNSRGVEFYVDLWPSSVDVATILRMAMFEAWDATTKTAIRTVPDGDQGVAPRADGSYPTDTTALGHGSYFQAVTMSTFSTTSEPYWALVSPDFLAVKAASTYSQYVGIYIPLVEGVVNDSPNLIATQLNPTSTPGTTPPGGYNRLPHRVGEAAVIDQWGASTGPLLTTYANPQLGTNEDLYGGNNFTVAIPIACGYTHGRCRGFLPADIKWVFGMPSTAYGDTITIDGFVYTHLGYGYCMKGS